MLPDTIHEIYAKIDYYSTLVENETSEELIDLWCSYVELFKTELEINK